MFDKILDRKFLCGFNFYGQQTLKLWDIKTFSLVKTINIQIDILAIYKNQKIIVIYWNCSKMKLVDLKTNTTIFDLKLDRIASFVTKFNNYILVGYEEEIIDIHQIVNRKLNKVKSLQVSQQKDMFETESSALQLNGYQIVTYSNNPLNFKLMIWDILI